MFTNDDSTKISYDIAYVFSLDRLEIPDIAWNMFIFKALRLVIFTDVDMVWFLLLVLRWA